MKFVLQISVGCLTVIGISSADAQQLTAQRTAEPIQAQRLAAPVSARFAEDVNPIFFVNSRQAELRDHHLVKAPPARASLAPLAELPAAAMGIPTHVAPAMAGAATRSISLTYNRPLSHTETSGITSTVTEPSVAASNDGVVLLTGNWFAAISKDQAQTFSFRNPYDIFSAGGSQGFCCDQVVVYDATHDIMFWYLQGVQDGSSNVGRLAFAAGSDIRDENWQYYDLTPANIGNWQNEWFDFPDLALGNNYLYVSTNSFATNGTVSSNDDSFARALVVRIDLEQVAAGAQITPDYFSSEEVFSLRPTQGATDTMHFGSHDFSNFGQGIIVFGWPENGTAVSRRDVQVDLWSNLPRESTGQDGNQWLRRSDFRMTAAWIVGSEAGFAWSAAGVQPFPQPHVRVAIVDVSAASNTTLAQPHLWNGQYAFAYPAAYPAGGGSAAVGIAVQYGGGGEQGINPAHAVGVLKRAADGSYQWLLQATAVGSNGPADGRWGDYLAVRPAGDGGNGWVATGYTLDGGPLPENVVPRIAYFEELAAPEIAMAAEREVANMMQSELRELRDRIDGLLRQLVAPAAGPQR